MISSVAATSHFHQGSTITCSNRVIIDLRIPCKGKIGASAHVSISRAQRGHQIYLLHKLIKTVMHNYILKRLQNDSLMTKTLKLAKIDKIDLQFLHLVLGAITIFIISHKEIQIIVLFVERLHVFPKISYINVYCCN